MKAHNPDNLTPEQVGTADGWRLLDEDELLDSDTDCTSLVELEWFNSMFETWHSTCVGCTGCGTYRTRLTRAELRAARGLTPEWKEGDPKPFFTRRTVAADPTPRERVEAMLTKNGLSCSCSRMPTDLCFDLADELTATQQQNAELAARVAVLEKALGRALAGYSECMNERDEKQFKEALNQTPK